MFQWAFCLFAVSKINVSLVQARRGLFYNAARPYPSLVRPGWKWTKEGRYWIAFREGKHGPAISAIFHEAADIPRRL